MPSAQFSNETLDSSAKCQLDVGVVDNILDHECFEQQFSFLDDLSLYPLGHTRTINHSLISHTRTLNHPFCFATPKTEEEIAKSRMESVPKRTRQDTEYCVRLWHIWSKYRCATTDESVPPLLEMDAQALQFRMNAEMKRLQAKGKGSGKKQVEPLTTEEEELLWNRKILGDHNPQRCLLYDRALLRS